MPSIEELGELWKQQYPGKFDDRTDREVGLELKWKYPSEFLEYRDQDPVNKLPAPVVPDILPPLSKIPHSSRNSNERFSNELEAIRNFDINLYSSLSANEGLRRNVESLIEYYDPARGRISSWWNRGKAEGRVKYLTVTNDEQRLLIEQAAMLERAAAEERSLKFESKRQQIEFNIFIARNAIALMELKTKADLIERAFDSGMTEEDFSAINKEQAQSYIRATEYERKVLIDHQIKTKEQQQAVDFALEQQSLKQHQEINGIQKLIDSVQHEISGIQNNPNYDEVTKYGLIKDRQRTLKTYREDKRAKENRLLQNNNGENV